MKIFSKRKGKKLSAVKLIYKLLSDVDGVGQGALGGLGALGALGAAKSFKSPGYGTNFGTKFTGGTGTK